MKESIKKRIEAVRRGEVPEGYVFQNHQLRPVDWEYEKIGKYLVPYDEFSNDTEAYPLATSSRQGLMLQSEYYNDQRYEETSGGFHVVPEGYVTYRHMSDDDIFRFNVNRMGNSVLVSPEYPVFTTSDGLHQDMLVSYLNNMKEFKVYCSAQKKGSTRTRMYFSRLGEFAMPIPPVKEQQKIASILTMQDKIIELEQQKIEEIKKVKRFFLEKMFPKEGQAVPEIRFNGFTAPWEQRKLGEMASLITKGTTPLDKSNTGVVNFVKIESIDESSGNITITQKISLDEHNGYLRRSQLKENDILFSIAGTLGRVTSVNSSILPANTNQALAIIRLKDGCLDYVKTYLKGKAVADFIKKNPTIGAQPNLSLEQVANLEIAIPTEYEQKIIGAFFCQLDNLITLHQRELAEVGKYKKAQMQLLLTGLVRVNA